MKAALVSLLLVMTLFAYASEPTLAMSAKAKNMADVIKDISYPNQAKLNATEGLVLVVLMVDETGDVTESKVVAYPCKELKSEVERALAGLKFEPAKNASGQAVPSIVRLPIEFTLEVD